MPLRPMGLLLVVETQGEVSDTTGETHEVVCVPERDSIGVCTLSVS